MAIVRIKPEPIQAEDVKMETVFSFSKEDGWFVFSIHEIEKSILDKHGKLQHKSLPDVFPIFSSQVVGKIRQFFGL